MEPEQTGAKNEVRAGSEVAGERVVRKTYPKPPRLWARFGRLCLLPESWAEAGRYPFHVTMWPLILAIMIAAALVGVGQGYRVMGHLRDFVAGYDAHYAPLQISSAGVISWAAPVKQPINLSNDAQSIVVDPTDKTKLDDLKTPYAYLLTSKELQFRMGPGEGSLVIADVAKGELPEPGKAALINGTTLKNFLDANGSSLFIEMLLFVWVGKMFSGAVWAAFIIFSVWPLAVIAARTGQGELMIPRRAALRFAAAVLVPLLMLDGVLELIGYPVSATIGAEGAWIFWFIVPAVMSFWAGKMAKGMYGPKLKAKQ